jgi:hypothetical protein
VSTPQLAQFSNPYFSRYMCFLLILLPLIGRIHAILLYSGVFPQSWFPWIKLFEQEVVLPSYHRFLMAPVNTSFSAPLRCFLLSKAALNQRNIHIDYNRKAFTLFWFPGAWNLVNPFRSPQHQSAVNNSHLFHRSLGNKALARNVLRLSKTALSVRV